MRKREQFPKALNISMSLIIVLNLALPAVCYLLWGSTVQPIVVSNLPNTAWYGIVARVALIVDLFFTFLVVIVPSRDIIEASIFGLRIFDINRGGRFQPSFLWNILIRTLLVAIVVGFAEAVGSFSSMMGIVSGLALSFMAFILPSVMRFHLGWKKDAEYRWWLVVIDFLLFLFGTVAMVTTTYMAIIGVLSGNFGVNTTCWDPATWSQCH